jgi:hypothetical protein
MAGTITVNTRSARGNRRVKTGTGSAVGNTLTINTGWGRVTAFTLTNKTTALNGSSSISGGVITVTTPGATDSVIWKAEGY